jgi:predicted O-methyltransferase YrrM
MEYFHRLNDYCEAHSTPPGDLLYQLERETHLKTLAPQMLSGPLQGQFLRMLSRMLRPQRILEVGTFTGYSALCLAEGLPPSGRLHTIEVNPELEYLIRKYVRLAGREQQIVLHLGDAAGVIPALEGPFDLAFLDAGKQDYRRHYELALPRLRSGGLLLADNVLWSGKVLEPPADADAESIRAFNTFVAEDERVEQVLLPVRDGLLLAQKR